MPLLRFAFCSQNLIAYDNCFFYVLTKCRSSSVCIDLNLDAGFFTSVGFASKGRPELFVLPLVKVIENVAIGNISKANLCDPRCTRPFKLSV
jgi:hypothetical protein